MLFGRLNDDKFGPRLFPSKGQTTVRPFLTIKVTYPEGKYKQKRENTQKILKYMND